MERMCQCVNRRHSQAGTKLQKADDAKEVGYLPRVLYYQSWVYHQTVRVGWNVLIWESKVVGEREGKSEGVKKQKSHLTDPRASVAWHHFQERAQYFTKRWGYGRVQNYCVRKKKSSQRPFRSLLGTNILQQVWKEVMERERGGGTHSLCLLIVVQSCSSLWSIKSFDDV